MLRLDRLTGSVSVSAGWPRLLWFVTDGKHVVKPPKDWHPPIRDATNDIAYIEVRAVLFSSLLITFPLHVAIVTELLNQIIKKGKKGMCSPHRFLLVKNVVSLFFFFARSIKPAKREALWGSQCPTQPC